MWNWGPVVTCGLEYNRICFKEQFADSWLKVSETWLKPFKFPLYCKHNIFVISYHFPQQLVFFCAHFLVSVVNEYAMKGLDKMEENLPILHKPADKVRRTPLPTLHYCLSECSTLYLRFCPTGGVRHSRYGVPFSGGDCDGWCRDDSGSSQRRYQQHLGHQDGPDG